ncbi:MAG: nucleotidyltransferase substrate binding protein [Alphaproteobacteria bacterium]|nr:nucleotidyltransferase substrate binding protein [Alphaproteobacteria bacterium]
MSQPNARQLQIAKEKYDKTYQLLTASVKKTTEYDVNKNYSPDEVEPYDAFSDRFMRTVETAIKFFRNYEYYLQAEQSQTLRDGLHQMEKLDLISNIDIWLEMRDIRNRIVHDYVPEKIAEMYLLIRTEFYTEIRQLHQKIQKIDLEI